MEEMTVSQAAELLGKTDRTVRNYIKEGRIKAKHVENQFGWEYRVYDLGEFSAAETGMEKAAETRPVKAVETKAETALQIVTLENQRLWEEYKQLREANNRLAYDLGTRDQRIKDLELALEKSRAQLTTPPPGGNEQETRAENIPASPPDDGHRREPQPGRDTGPVIQKEQPETVLPDRRPWWKKFLAIR